MELSREVIAEYFHIPIVQAAKEFNVCLSIFKSRCQDVGIMCWPCHKLMSLQTLTNHF